MGPSESDENLLPNAAPYFSPPTDNCFIENLPDDILREIFFLLNTPSFCGFDHQYRTEFAVCRRWNTLQLKTPLLWTKIYDSDGPTARGKLEQSASYERSYPALIDLTINSWPIKSLSPTAINKGYVSPNARRHASRIRSLMISASELHDGLRTLNNWSDIETPNLSSIHVHNFNEQEIPSDFANVPPNTSVISWPRSALITELRLIGLSVFQCPPAPQLRELHVAKMLLTPTGLREIATRHPLLHTWTIDFLGPWLPDEEPADRAAVQFPSLSKLAIGSSHVHSGDCGCGMGCLAAPNIEHLELRCSPSVLNMRHFSTLLHRRNTKRLHTLRIAVGKITLEDLPFLETLPSVTDLEFPKLDKQDVSLVGGLLALTNVRSITIDIHLPNQCGDPITMDTLCVAILHKPKVSALVQLRPRYCHGIELPSVVKDYLDNKLQMLRPYYDDYPWLIESWTRLYDFDFSEKLSGFGDFWHEGDESDYDDDPDYSDGSYEDEEGWEVPSHDLDSDDEDWDQYEYNF